MGRHGSTVLRVLSHRRQAFEEPLPSPKVARAYAPTYVPPVYTPPYAPVYTPTPTPAPAPEENSGKKADFIASELRKCKAMLDEGLITEEDYNQKKNQLLNL